jgi:NTE family protein
MANSRHGGSGEPKPRATKTVNLALQGGGAHGAYTWGVIDALLEDGRLVFEGLSGTSAGAMNAAVMATGLALGGPRLARERLESFWKAVSIDGELGESQRMLFDIMLGAWGYGSDRHNGWFDIASRIFSPYDANPLDLNPLRGAVERFVDCAAVRGHESLKLFIAATNVYSGKVRVFRRPELSADVLMASACLPLVFKAVTIEKEPYWDGGYMGNPVLFPFFTETDTEDIILVQINPIERRDVPDDAREIVDRMNEITFNSSLLHELRAIEFVGRLIDQGRLEGTHYKKIRMHRIDAGKELSGYGAATKFKADWAFFQELHAAGRKAGKTFLKRHFEAIGVEGTMDIRAELA